MSDKRDQVITNEALDYLLRTKQRLTFVSEPIGETGSNCVGLKLERIPQKRRWLVEETDEPAHGKLDSMLLPDGNGNFKSSKCGPAFFIRVIKFMDSE